MTAGAALWCAVIAAEGAALAMAVRCTPGRAGSWGWTLVGKLTRPASHPVVALLAFALVSDLVTAAGGVLLLNGAPRPFVGVARAWWHLETALVIGWPVALASASWMAFTYPSRLHREPAPSLAWGAGLGGWALLVLAHPVPRGLVATVLLAVEAVSVIVAWLAVAKGWRRPWSGAHVALLVLVPVETVVLVLGPFGRDVFRDWSTLARIPYAVGFAAVAWALGWRGRG